LDVAETFVKRGSLAKLKGFDIAQFVDFNRITAASQDDGLSGEVFDDAGDGFRALRIAIANDDLVSGCEWQDQGCVLRETSGRNEKHRSEYDAIS